jgi:hypothetical protein
LSFEETLGNSPSTADPIIPIDLLLESSSQERAA